MYISGSTKSGTFNNILKHSRDSIQNKWHIENK